MNKIYLWVVIIILLPIVLFSVTYTVDDDGGQHYEEIQAAIEDPIVVNGDTLLVYPGIYEQAYPRN